MESKVAARRSIHEILQWMNSARGDKLGQTSFFGKLLNGCQRREEPGLGTIAVSISKVGRYQLIYDPEWFSSRSPRQQLIHLTHEATHLLCCHVERKLKLMAKLSPEEWDKINDTHNIAADIAANDTGLRAVCTNEEWDERKLNPENFGFPTGESFDEYFALLLEKEGESPAMSPEEMEEILSAIYRPYYAGGTPKDQWPQDWKETAGDSHKYWGQALDGMSEEEVNNAARGAHRDWKRIVAQAVEQTENTRGTVPGNLQRFTALAYKESKVPWNIILSGLLKSTMSTKFKESTAVPNVALMHLKDLEPYPGYQRDFTFNLAIFIDTSGSVGEDTYAQFISEIRKIMKVDPNVKARIIMFDAAIQYEGAFDGENDYNKTEMNLPRCGYGGTDFCVPFRRILNVDEDKDWAANAERVTDSRFNPDAIVMLTDGYAPVESPGGPIPDLLPQCPVIWAICSGGMQNDAMGDRVVSLED